MRLPVTPEQFLDGFGRFNTATWPLHVVMIAVTVAIVILAFRGGPRVKRGGWSGSRPARILRPSPLRWSRRPACSPRTPARSASG